MGEDDSMAAPNAERRRLSAEERRAQIIAATAEAISDKGYANATLTEITERAGVAKGLLWHYFEDRDDLMRQTLHQVAAEIRDAVVEGLDPQGGVPDVIRSVMTRTAALARTHATQLNTIDQIVHQFRAADGSQAITFDAYDSIYAEHEQLLARGQREGTVRSGDLRVMAVNYQGVIDATIGYLQAHPDVDGARYAKAAADVLLSGLQTEAPA